MATTKVSQLTELTSAADDDLLLVADTSVNQSKKIQKSNITEQNFTTTLKNKLDGIEASADVTDTTNVVAALTAGTNITIAADGTISATDTDTGILNVVEDTTPQLGGDLDLNSSDITGTGNIDVTGTVTSDGFTVENSATNYLSITRDGSTGHYNFTSEETGSSIQFFTDPDGTGADKRLTIDRYGDISFYEDTGATAKLFWDASAESLGIGTTSPATALHAKGSITVGTFESTSGNSDIQLKGTGSTGYTAIRENTDAMMFLTNTSERMRIDSSGNVGIGTGSPSQKLNIDGNALATGWFRGGAGSASSPTFIVDGGSGMFRGSANDIGFSTSSTERMRIDSSGYLLVGTTDNSPYNNTSGSGFAVSPVGHFSVTREGVVGYFNRNTSDGDIVHFRKDGTTVGTISTTGGQIRFGKGSTAIQADGSSAIVPKQADGTTANGTINLGNSSNKWNNLYLAGTANVLNARSADVTDNDGSFDLDAGTNFTCTPTANFTLTFTNIPDGQSGTIVLINSGGYTVSAAATTKVMGADMLTTISTAGTYVIGYISDGTNVRVYNSAAQQ